MNETHSLIPLRSQFVSFSKYLALSRACKIICKWNKSFSSRRLLESGEYGSLKGAWFVICDLFVTVLLTVPYGGLRSNIKCLHTCSDSEALHLCKKMRTKSLPVGMSDGSEGNSLPCESRNDEESCILNEWSSSVEGVHPQREFSLMKEFVPSPEWSEHKGFAEELSQINTYI